MVSTLRCGRSDLGSIPSVGRPSFLTPQSSFSHRKSVGSITQAPTASLTIFLPPNASHTFRSSLFTQTNHDGDYEQTVLTTSTRIVCGAPHNIHTHRLLNLLPRKKEATNEGRRILSPSQHVLRTTGVYYTPSTVQCSQCVGSNLSVTQSLKKSVPREVEEFAGLLVPLQDSSRDSEECSLIFFSRVTSEKFSREMTPSQEFDR